MQAPRRWCVATRDPCAAVRLPCKQEPHIFADALKLLATTTGIRVANIFNDEVSEIEPLQRFIESSYTDRDDGSCRWRHDMCLHRDNTSEYVFERSYLVRLRHCLSLGRGANGYECCADGFGRLSDFGGTVRE